MSTFSENVLTNKGKELLAQATSSDRLVYTRAFADTEYYSDASLSQLDSPFSCDVEGVIVSCSAVDNVARIIAGFSNQQESISIKSVFIFGRLESESSSVEHCIIACSDNESSIRIPSTSEASVQVQISFNVAVDDDASVTVSSGNYASVGDLDRMMSCHKAGQPTVGEDQDVYGYKSFHNGIDTNAIYTLDDDYIIVHSIRPEDPSCFAGTANYPFGEICTLNTYTNSIQSIDGSVNDYITIGNNLKPETGLEIILGSNSNPFEAVYSTSVRADEFRGVQGDVIELYADLTPYDNGSVCLGNENIKFNNVYSDHFTGDLDGMIPTPTVGTNPGTDLPDIPVGSIVVLALTKSDRSAFTTLSTVYCGQSIYTNGGTLENGNQYDDVFVGSFRTNTNGSGEPTLKTYIECSTPLSRGMIFKVLVGSSNNGGLDMISCLAIRTA